MEIDDERPPASPAESLRLIEQERAAAERGLAAHPMAFFGPWGTAWLVGFGLLFLRFGPDGRVFVPMPPWLPLLGLFALLLAAAAVSGYVAGRAYRHIRRQSATQGRMYGLAWFLAFLGMGTTLPRFADHLPEAEAGLLWGSVAVGLTGALHLAGSAIWRDRWLFALGAWLILINILGTAAGPGWHSLVISVAGGGTMLLLGTALWLHGWRR